MAGYRAVQDVGASVVKLLKDRLQLLTAADPFLKDLTVRHAGLGDVAKVLDDTTVGLCLLCYRILPSPHQRPQAPARGAQRPSRVGLDLHYLLIAAGKDAEQEAAILGWAMLQLHRFPTLDRSILRGSGAGWERDEIVHFAPEPISHEALFRIWDVLQPKYRLSAAYVARVVQIQDQDAALELDPVVESQFGFADQASAEAVLAEAAP